MCGYQIRNILPTGLWIDRGPLDASTNPPFPAAKVGEVYTISAAGVIGDSDASPGLEVEAGDIIHCTADNQGGLYITTQSSWNSLQANLNPDDLSGSGGPGSPLSPLSP